MAGGAGGAHQLVTGIGNQRSPGVADQCDRLLAEPGDDPLALLAARMVVVAAHRHFRADMREQFCSDSRVFHEDAVGPAQGVGGARAEVAEIADRCRDDVQPGGKPLIHEQLPISSSNSMKKGASSWGSSGCLGRGSMIALLGASAIFLTASQAVINGPREAFKTCLKEASAATKEAAAAKPAPAPATPQPIPASQSQPPK